MLVFRVTELRFPALRKRSQADLRGLTTSFCPVSTCSHVNMSMDNLTHIHTHTQADMCTYKAHSLTHMYTHVYRSVWTYKPFAWGAHIYKHTTIRTGTEHNTLIPVMQSHTFTHMVYPHLCNRMNVHITNMLTHTCTSTSYGPMNVHIHPHTCTHEHTQNRSKSHGHSFAF